MMRRWKLFALGAVLAFAMFQLPGCYITPTVSMGVGVGYYGGGFRPRPYGNVGFVGHP